MGRAKPPEKKKPAKVKRHWRYVAVQADHQQGRTLQRCTGYDPWQARIWVELHGVRLYGPWHATPQTLEFPFDCLLRVPAWVGGVELAYRTARGEFRVVPHTDMPAIVVDGDRDTLLTDLPEDHPALTLHDKV